MRLSVIRKISAVIAAAATAFTFMLTALPHFSAETFSDADKIVIVLDPGHGGTGDTVYRGCSEAAFNITVAKYLREYLNENGNFKVYLTHESNETNPTFYQRAALADSVNADIMISVHFNALITNLERRGTEGWCSVVEKYDLEELARVMLEKTNAALPSLPTSGIFHRKDSYGYFWDSEHQWDTRGQSDSGQLSDYYSIITWGIKFGVPTFILEEAYLTNEQGKDIALNDANLRTIARAQADALAEYYTNHTHTYGETERDIPLSCISAGKQSRHCTVCGHRTDVSTLAAAPDPDAHFYKEGVGGGDGNWVCEYTESLITQASVPDVHNHTGGAYVADGEPEPEPSEPSSEPDADPDSTSQTTATDTKKVKNVTDNPDHNFTKFIDGFEMMGGAGYAVYECTDCGERMRVDFRAGEYDCSVSGHVPFPDDEVQNTYPTCEKGGAEHYYCLACRTEYVIESPALGHKYELQAQTPATCVTVGQKTEQCTVCGKILTTELPMTEHEYEVQTSSATCTQDGYERKVCKVCASAVETRVPATGHDFELTDEKAAGLFLDGSKTFVCKKCRTEYIETVKSKIPLAAGVGALAIIAAVVLTIIFAVRRGKKIPELDTLFDDSDTDGKMTGAEEYLRNVSRGVKDDAGEKDDVTAVFRESEESPDAKVADIPADGGAKTEKGDFFDLSGGGKNDAQFEANGQSGAVSAADGAERNEPTSDKTEKPEKSEKTENLSDGDAAPEEKSTEDRELSEALRGLSGENGGSANKVSDDDTKLSAIDVLRGEFSDKDNGGRKF